MPTARHVTQRVTQFVSPDYTGTQPDANEKFIKPASLIDSRSTMSSTEFDDEFGL